MGYKKENKKMKNLKSCDYRCINARISTKCQTVQHVVIITAIYP